MKRKEKRPNEMIQYKRNYNISKLPTLPQMQRHIRLTIDIMGKYNSLMNSSLRNLKSVGVFCAASKPPLLEYLRSLQNKTDSLVALLSRVEFLCEQHEDIQKSLLAVVWKLTPQVTRKVALQCTIHLSEDVLKVLQEYFKKGVRELLEILIAFPDNSTYLEIEHSLDFFGLALQGLDWKAQSLNEIVKCLDNVMKQLSKAAHNIAALPPLNTLSSSRTAQRFKLEFPKACHSRMASCRIEIPHRGSVIEISESQNLREREKTAVLQTEPSPEKANISLQYEIAQISHYQAMISSTINGMHSTTASHLVNLKDRLQTLETTIKRFSQNKLLSYETALEYIREGRIQDAYSVVLSSHNNFHVIRLMGRTGVVLDRLKESQCTQLMPIILEFLQQGEFIVILLNWVSSALKLSVTISLTLQQDLLNCLNSIILKCRLSEGEIEQVKLLIHQLQENIECAIILDSFP